MVVRPPRSCPSICVDPNRPAVAGGESTDDGTFETSAVLPGDYFLGTYDEDGDRVWYVAGGPAVDDFGSATSVTVTTAGVSGIVIDIAGSEPPAQTPVGTDVGVVPVDPDTGATPVGLTFDNVTQAGETSLVITGTGAGAPAGFQLGVPATYYRISTTASFDGLVTVCISYTGIAFSQEATLRLFHRDRDTGTWEDQTTSHDPDNDIICGRTDSFSPFALFQRTFKFTQFRAPVDDLPKVNKMKAGKAVNVVFGVGGDFGLGIFADGSPSSQRFHCANHQPIDKVEKTTRASESSLAFDAGTGRYVLHVEDQGGLGRDLPHAHPDLPGRIDRERRLRVQGLTARGGVSGHRRLASASGYDVGRRWLLGPAVVAPARTWNTREPSGTATRRNGGPATFGRLAQLVRALA